MTYKADIIKFIKSVLEATVFEAEILTNIDNLDGTHTLVLKDVMYLQKGFTQTIDGKDYEILSVDADTDTVVLKGADAITVDTFTLYPIKFFYGNIRETANELKDYEQSRDKTPMLYVYEEFKETFDEDVDSIIERESDLRLFFLTQADFQDWQRQDFQNNAIMPMRRAEEKFIAQLKETKYVNRITSHEIINKTRFGVFINEKGVDKAYWADNLSGVESRVSFELWKPETC